MSTHIQPGQIRTVAGSGDCGFTGDGALATAARLNEPKSLTIDGRGNMIIADSENHLVRKVDRETGVISTIAGCVEISEPRLQSLKSHPGPETEAEDPFGDSGTMGERAFAQQTDLSGTVRYVAGGAEIAKRFGGDGGKAKVALLNFPTAVAVDKAGHVYIADTMNHRIRRVEVGTDLITTFAGVGQPRYGGDGGPAISAGLNEPAALVVSESGILYIADQSNNRVRAIDLSTGLIRTVAGTGSATYNGDGGAATEAALAGPSGLALGADDTLYIADTFNGRIRAVDPCTGVIRTVSGDGQMYHYQGAIEPPSVSLSRPSGIAVDADGNLFITDSDNHLVRRWDRKTGRLERLAGVGVANFGGDGGTALEASLNYPFGVALGLDGRLFIADTFNHRIREVIL
ncbi:NHL domain-containing protein [Petrachloros mirabilis]